jgi:replicative DNA helicase
VSAGDAPPASVASEKAVIGAVMLSGGEALDELTLTPQDFAHGAYSRIYEQALALHEARRPVDQFTLADSLPARYEFEVHDAAGSVFAWHNVGYYADLVAEASLRRRVAEAGQMLVNLARDGDGAALPDLARTLLDSQLGAPKGHLVPTMHDRFEVYMQRMAEPVHGTPTPWANLTEALGGGLRPGGFYVIGARPGVGKSAIALQLANALGDTGPVLFSSLEMGEQEVALRVFAQQNRIPFTNLLHNTLAPFMRERLMAWRAVNPMNIAIDDTPDMTVFDIRNRARSMHRNRPLAGIVVDYLQLMRDPRDLPRHEKVAEMTRNLKLLSRELQIPVIACSQLNRESTRRGDGTPSLSDLRESGSIEQDADVVILLHRDDDDAGLTPGEELALILAKNRQGRTGTVFTQWQGEFVRAMSSANG